MPVDTAIPVANHPDPSPNGARRAITGLDKPVADGEVGDAVEYPDDEPANTTRLLSLLSVSAV